jgi:hypothetical protein
MVRRQHPSNSSLDRFLGSTSIKEACGSDLHFASATQAGASVGKDKSARPPAIGSLERGGSYQETGVNTQ